MAHSPVYHKNNFNLIRLLAAFQVLIVHICNTLGIDLVGLFILKMFPGVPIFFFISGYLISQSYERTRENGLWDYATRRALRIFPALWLVTIFAATLTIATGFLPMQILLTCDFWLWFFSQVTIVQFYNPDIFHGYGDGVINGALWTLSVELQFYLLVPILAFLIRKTPVFIFPVILISVVANIMAHVGPDQYSLLNKLMRVTFLPWVYMFIFGALVANWPQLRQRVLRLNVIFVLLAFILAMVFIGTFEANSSNAINPVAVTLLMILVFKMSQSERVYKIPGQKLLRRHDISYGIYVFHMPIINTLIYLAVLPIIGNAIFAFVASVTCAALSWFHLEKPALKMKGARRT